MTIAVVAGHYPDRPGAVTPELREHDEAVYWRDKIAAELEALHIRTKVIRAYTLHDKVREINTTFPKCELAMEIHFNSDPGRAGRGCETLYCPGSTSGEGWAQAIQRSMVPFCSPNRGIKEGWYRMDQPDHIDYAGDVEGDEIVDYFLRATNCPAIIVEPYFLHEHPRIIANRDVVCMVIAETIAGRLDQLEQ